MQSGVLSCSELEVRALHGRDDRIRTCDLCVPNAALYQTEPHLDTSILIDLYIISRDFRFVKGFLKKNWNFLILSCADLFNPLITTDEPTCLRQSSRRPRHEHADHSETAPVV